MVQRIGASALVVEGGAMRGVFSCGILDYFLEQNFSPFDSFWGVSAGASNLAAYLANMPGRNRKIYLDYSLRKPFISPTQLLRGGNVMNLDWMWDITLRELGIDKARLAAEKRPFFMGVTRQDTGQAEYLTPSADRVTETMKASSAVPILYREGVTLEGGLRYVDGGVTDAIPVAEAIKRGATHIMVLRSRPASYRKSKGKLDWLMKPMLKDTPALIAPMMTRYERYNRAIEIINHPPKGVTVTQICPPEHFTLTRLSQSTEKLEEAYRLGLEAGKEAIFRWCAT
ncbi:patatin-like phospholipase family protein [Veronia pacifica]|uniref:Patatin family protein n=1 Tax=Veronia pacifica TaxID=1080227 RepID=A0A1C3E6K1_9GAMM|nr:patatin family protein [Veronia pacifica]ODA28866.1 patatin family protein [Veronia pacifica]